MSRNQQGLIGRQAFSTESAEEPHFGADHTSGRKPSGTRQALEDQESLYRTRQDLALEASTR